MDEAGTPRRPRARRNAALLLLAGLFCVAALATALRGSLAGRLARTLLAMRGVESSFHVAELGWRGAQLDAVSVGPAGAPALVARRVDLAWSLAGLRDGHLDRFAIEGARLAATLDAGGIRLEGPAGPRDGDPGAGLALAARAGALEIRDADLSLETPAGAMSLRGGGWARLTAERFEGSFRLDGATPYGGIEATLALTGTPDDPEIGFEASARPEPGALPLRLDSTLRAHGTLRRDGEGAPRVELALALPWLELAGRARLEQIAVDAAGGAAELRAQVRVARLVDRGAPALVAPLAVEAELRGPLERLELEGVARPQVAGLVGELSGVVEPLARRAELRLRVPETALAGASEKPARLLPFLEDRIVRARGRVGLELRARFEHADWSAIADVAVRDLDLRTPQLTLRRVNGAIRFEAPPLRTPPGQLVAVAAIEGGLPLADGLVRFQLTPEGILALESARFGVAAGQLRASGVLPLATTERSLVLVAEGLDVEAILASLGFAGLSGTGTLAGTLPLRQQGSRFVIDGGQLRATAPGVLRYRPDPGSAAAAARDERLATVMGALGDLHYDELELAISGDTAEEVSVKVHARGRNPGYQQGRPVVLNLDLEAHLADLVRVGRAAYRVPEEVEERVERALEPEER